MINNVLLVSEDFIRTNSNLSDNAFGKFLLPAIREAQHIHLQTILGTNLYESILLQVSAGTLSGEYKTLVDDYCRWYLLYQTLSDIVDVLDIKMVNLGTVVSRDDYVQNITEDERERLRQNYAYKGDFYAKRLQQYLIANYDSFPELKECDCNRIKENLKSSASTGLWLGGMRGKVYRPVKGSCCKF